MIAVYKYNLPMDDYVTINLPRGAEVLHVGVQHGETQLWAKVDTGKPAEKRRFRIAGTGHPLDGDKLEFVGTLMLAGGGLVFHVFEVVG